MSRDAGALLGGLLIGGLVVGAAMSADNAAQRQNERNYRRHQRQQQRALQHSTFCICGAQMAQGRVQQGVPKCNNLNCQRILTNEILYYCPNGGNVACHRKGFFYCQQCAARIRAGVKAKQLPVQQPQPQPQPQMRANNGYPGTAKQYKSPVVVKQGYMSKKGGWLNHSFKKRWFKLYSNKKMAYLETPNSTHTKGYADFTKIKKMEKKANNGFEVTTNERVWTFLCNSTIDRDAWFLSIQNICMHLKPTVYVQQPPQPQVQYVQQPPQPQPQVQYVAQPQPQPPQPIYQQPVQPPPQPQPQHQPQPEAKSQALEPGMVGYNGGNMYGGYTNNNNVQSAPSQQYVASAPPPPQSQQQPIYNNNINQLNNNMNNMNNMNLNNNNNGNWEASAPPAAYAEPSAPSAPPEDDEQPAEGAFTGQ